MSPYRNEPRNTDEPTFARTAEPADARVYRPGGYHGPYGGSEMMTTDMPIISMDVLRDLRKSTVNMVSYYDPSVKIAENSAMMAANLVPKYKSSELAWDEAQLAIQKARLACLDAVIAKLEKEYFK